MDLFSNELTPQMALSAVTGAPLIGMLSNLLGSRPGSTMGGATPGQLGTPTTPGGGMPPPGVNPGVINQTGGGGATPPQPPGLPPPPELQPGGLGQMPWQGSVGASAPGSIVPLGMPQGRQGQPGQTTPAFQQPSSGVPAVGGANAPGGASTQSRVMPPLGPGGEAGLTAGGYGSGPGQILVPQQWLKPMQDTDAKYGLPFGQMGRTARIESAFNPMAKNGNAEGLMQFEPGTAAQWHLQNPFDPIASIDAAGRYAQASMKGLTAAMGRPAEGWEIYMAHQQGLGGALALMKNPDMNAVEALKTLPAYQNPKKPDAAMLAIRNNGGNVKGSAQQFLDLWANKFNLGKTPGPTGGPAAAGPVGTKTVGEPGEAAGRGEAAPAYAEGAHPALVAAHQAGDPILTMALLQSIAPFHKFEPVGYDPFKEAPPAQQWQNVPLGG